MKIFLGADHGGFALKEELKSWLITTGFEVVDCGARMLDSQDDYPEFAVRVAEAVAKEPDILRGILVCRSGAGMVIVANKVKRVRAAAVNNPDEAEHAREHNDVNVLSLAADWVEQGLVQEIVLAFLQTEFSTAPRHRRRVAQIAHFEQTGQVTV